MHIYICTHLFFFVFGPWASMAILFVDSDYKALCRKLKASTAAVVFVVEGRDEESRHGEPTLD